MRSTIVRCSACDHALSLPDAVGAGTLRCDQCEAVTQLWLFPALYRPAKSAGAQLVVDEGHSSCMNHPNKIATAVCDGCGKFLCALCDIEWSGEHLCSTCIEHRKDAGAQNDLKSEYVHYDRIVFALAVASLLFYFMGVIFAPIALYIGWRYWKEPWRPVPYRKWGMVASIVLAFAVLAGWGAFFSFFIINLG